MFEIGEKVVCVDVDPWDPEADRPDEIQLGVVYTITAMHPDYDYDTNYMVVHLKEVENLDIDTFKDVGYYAYRFRKLIKKKQSIETFQKIRKNVEDNAHIYSLIPEDELEKFLQ